MSSPRPSRRRAQETVPADWAQAALAKRELVDLVVREGALHYRDLPWRNLDDAFSVLVSEVMLQQTQVVRVMDYWPRFMRRFPTIDALAAAASYDVLALWQGLGYNRRALGLKRTADVCAAQWQGRLPSTVDELVRLPGVGPATAAGVVAFAYNEPAVYVETNVRTVFLHELFPEREGVTDKELAPYVRDAGGAAARVGVSPRVWNYALLDYGAHLKARHPNPSRRSAHYARQGAFAGSHREKRSYVLQCVLARPEGIERVEVKSALDEHERQSGRDGLDDEAFEAIVDELRAEGFFRLSGGRLVP